MASRPTPQEAVQRWQENFAGSSNRYIKGVQRVAVAPTAKAARSAEKMVRNLKAAVDDGSYAAKCNAVTLQDWQNQAIQFGAPNLANGAAKGAPKMERFLSVQLPITYRIADAVKAMPDDTESQREQRVLTFMREMRKNKYSRRGASRT